MAPVKAPLKTAGESKSSKKSFVPMADFFGPRPKGQAWPPQEGRVESRASSYQRSAPTSARSA